jgi:hypothetical protein
MTRWQLPVFEEIKAHLDPLATSGRAVQGIGLDARIFDCRPESHAPPDDSMIREAYEALRQRAVADGRLGAGAPLIKRWKLVADIYSPRLRRFIEVDERQHFSRARLIRLVANRRAMWSSLYPAHFWDKVLPCLIERPRRDLDPPHRDEQRAYRDEMRERLPVLYGLRRTIRLDEFTLGAIGLEHVSGVVAQLTKEKP